MLSDMILEGLYKSKSKNSVQLQTVMALNDQDQAQTKSDENPSGRRKLTASLPDLRNVEYTNHRHMGKIFQYLENKLRMYATNATFSMDAYKTM